MGSALEKHHRRSIRLPGYDYRDQAAYFITICTYNREHLFGFLQDVEMILNDCGLIVQDEWLLTAKIRRYVILDEYVVMPNHVHGIVIINNDIWMDAGNVGATGPVAPTTILGQPHQYGGNTPVDRPNGPRSGSIGAIIGQFKTAAVKRINIVRNTPRTPIWQRNYYEHIIRNEEEMFRIREYIRQNPANWSRDENR